MVKNAPSSNHIFITTLLAMFIPAVILVVTAHSLMSGIQVAQADLKTTLVSKALITRTNTLAKLFFDCTTALGGFSITRSPDFRNRFDNIARTIPVELEAFKQVDTSTQHQQSRTIEKEITGSFLFVRDHKLPLTS